MTQRDEAASREEARDERVTRRAAFIALVLFILLIIWLLSQFGRVPDVRGLTTDGAKNIIVDAGFEVGAVIEQTSTTLAGTVFEQSPAPGRLVLKGSDLAITISLGDGSVADVENDRIEIARQEDLDWEAVFPSEWVVIPDDRPPYDPQYLQYGSRIPSVHGLSETSAIAVIEDSGYVATIGYDYSSTDVDAGAAMYQDPPPDTIADPGTVVEVVISLGPPPIDE